MRCHDCEKAGTDCGLTGGVNLDPGTRALHELLVGAAMELASRKVPGGADVPTARSVNRFLLRVLTRPRDGSDSSLAELKALVAEGEKLEAATEPGPEAEPQEEPLPDPDGELDMLRAHIDCMLRDAACRAREAGEAGRESEAVHSLLREILALLRDQPARREELVHILLLCEDLESLTLELPHA